MGDVLNTPEGTDIFDSSDVNALSVLTVPGFSMSGQGLGAGSGKTTRAAAEEDSEAISARFAYVPWGDSDNFPDELLGQLSFLGVVGAGLEMNADMHYGAGLIWVKDELSEDGKLVKKPQLVPKWTKFCRDVGFNLVLSDAINSLGTFGIAWVEVVLDDKGKNIVSMQCLDTPRTRSGLRNKKGRIPYVVYNVHETLTIEDHIKIPMWNPNAPFKSKRFVFQMTVRSWNRPYYPEPNYYRSFRAGWADTAKSVGSFYKNVFSNSMSLKYHIIAPLSFFKAKFKDWDSKTEQEHLKILLDWKDGIDKHLTGSENAHKTVVTLWDDKRFPDSQVKIEPIKNYLDKESQLPTNTAATAEMLNSLGAEPTLMGLITTGGGELNGSGGSNKREARKNKQSNLKREREVSLLLGGLVHVIMGLDDDWYPAYLDSDTSQTMDENPTGKQNVLT